MHINDSSYDKFRLRQLGSQRRMGMLLHQSAERQIGEIVANYVKRIGPEYTALAILAGVSPNHAKNLAARVTAPSSAPDGEEDRDSVIWSDHRAVAEFVKTRGSTVVRICIAFHEFDVFWLSGVRPELFLPEGVNQGPLRLPSMLLVLDDGQLVAVDNVCAGYDGNGPDQAAESLEDLGLPRQLARAVADSRWSRLELRNGAWHADSCADSGHNSEEWPRFRTEAPEALICSRAGMDGLTEAGYVGVVHMTSEMLNGRGYLRSENAATGDPVTSHARSIAALLDDPDLPKWARGARAARLYPTEQGARMAGHIALDKFAAFPPRSEVVTNTYRLVVEQGALQVWFELEPPAEAGALFSQDTYKLLSGLGLYPADIEAETEDDKARFQRWWDRNVRGRTLPDWLDISPTGTSLAFTPSLATNVTPWTS